MLLDAYIDGLNPDIAYELHRLHTPTIFEQVHLQVPQVEDAPAAKAALKIHSALNALSEPLASSSGANKYSLSTVIQ